MSTICIGGICLPTYALVPIAIIVLQMIWEWFRKSILGHSDVPENSRVIHVTSEEQWKELHTKSKATNRTLVVDFTASWCGPCRFISPFYHELSTKYPCSIFLKVDVDEVKSIARSCGVNAMPTFQVFKRGAKVQELCGANKKGLETMIQQHYVEVELPEDESLKSGDDNSGLHQRHVNVTAIHSLKEWEQLHQTSKTSNKTVVVDFTATWCGPCKKIAPFFEQLSTKYPSMIFAKLDVDEVEDVAAEQGVNSMPTFKVYKHGKCVDELNGALQTALQSMIVRHATK